MPERTDNLAPPSATRPRALELALVGAITASAVVGWVAAQWRMGGINDFGPESWPAFHALLAGHVLRAVRLGPAYVGSLVLRAPFALLAALCGGGERAVYFATALPCLLVAVGLGTWLATHPELWSPRIDASGKRRISPMVLCAINPIVVLALLGGHPEEVLGAALCVAAVLTGRRDRPVLAGVLVGLAIVNKSWALAAAPAILVTLPAGQRRATVAALATTAMILGPLVAIRSTGATSSAGLGSGTGSIFLHPQLLWWFGPHAWISQHAHPLLIAVAWLLCAIWWVVRGRGRRSVPPSRDEALLLLAFVLLVRCALDPWDNVYYHLPFLFAIMAWEAGGPARWTARFTVALLIVVPQAVLPVSADVHALLYAMVAVPTLLILGRRLFLTPRVRFDEASSGGAGPAGEAPVRDEAAGYIVAGTATA